MLSQLLEDLLNGINMIRFIDVDQDIILIVNDKNIELLGHDLVNVALKTCRSIGYSQWHYLIFEMTVSISK